MRSLVRIKVLAVTFFFACLAYAPQLFGLSPGWSYVLFGLACCIALLAATIRCETCETLFYKYTQHGLPVGFLAMLSNHCPVCQAERL
jgi:hypothetical protein